MTWLVATSIKTSLILAIGMLTAIVLRRRSSAVRHWVLATAIFCGAGVPIVGLVTPSWTIPMFRAPVKDAAPTVQFSVKGGPARDARAVQSLSPPVQPESTSTTRISEVVLPIWLAGTMLNLSVLLFGMSRLTRLGSPLVIRRTDEWSESLSQVSEVLGVTRPVTLVRSERPAVLVTWGVFRPKILLPADASDWSRERIDVVLAHELAHVARGDWLVQTIAEALKAVYWFNPLFWVACARLRHESEYACDDTVMNSGVSSVAYATHLLELARCFGRHRQTWLPAPAMAARPSNLERRVRAMLNVRVNRSPIGRFGRWASALAFIALTLPIVSFAQGSFSTFSGVVVDPQDRVLPATTVTVTDSQRHVKHETSTDGNGRFELVGLAAGDYTIEATLPGFQKLTGMVTLDGQSVDRTLQMYVSSLHETINVVSDDGAITNAHQRGTIAAKRPVPACPTGSVSGVGGNLRAPHKVKDVAPGYPGVDGNVELLATIGTDGSVVDVQVVKADRPELGPAAIDAVRQWEFDSTLLNCEPIEVQMNVSISFRREQ